MNNNKYMNPYLAGFFLGLILLATIFITGRGLGASGAFKSVEVEIMSIITPSHTGAAQFYKEYMDEHEGQPMKNWLVFEIIGVVIGAFVSGLISNRLKFKLEWEDRLLKFLKKLDKKKPLVICGDFNVAREEIDIARPKENQKNAGFTAEERGWMSKFLAAGFVDVFRQQHPDKVQYTWWLYYANARARNIGWRIDYFCVSWYLFKLVKRSFILDQIQGSDHCPVGIEFE